MYYKVTIQNLDVTHLFEIFIFSSKPVLRFPHWNSKSPGHLRGRVRGKMAWYTHKCIRRRQCIYNIVRKRNSKLIVAMATWQTDLSPQSVSGLCQDSVEPSIHSIPYIIDGMSCQSRRWRNVVSKLNCMIYSLQVVYDTCTYSVYQVAPPLPPNSIRTKLWFQVQIGALNPTMYL